MPGQFRLNLDISGIWVFQVYSRYIEASHLFAYFHEVSFFLQNVICEHEISNIFCACQDGDHLNFFAYITQDIVAEKHYCHVFCVRTMVSELLILPMPRLLSSKAKGCKDFGKASKPCHVGIHWIALAEY